jgi:hypothetical protein
MGIACTFVLKGRADCLKKRDFLSGYRGQEYGKTISEIML